MSVRLVINADDLGLAPFIDEGILEAARLGVVRSASLLASGPSSEAAAGAAKAQGLGLGVHLALSGGLPPTAPADRVPSLLEGGRLVPSWTRFVQRFLAGQVRLEEVELELSAQVERVLGFGVTIDHVDGHQHLHVFPGVLDRVLRVCERHRIWAMRLPAEPAGHADAAGELKRAAVSVFARGARARLPGWMRVPDTFSGVAQSGRLDEASVLAWLARLSPGTHELGCHPGKGSGVVPADPGWRAAWSQELAALTSPRLRAEVDRRGFGLIRFSAL